MGDDRRLKPLSEEATLARVSYQGALEQEFEGRCELEKEEGKSYRFNDEGLANLILAYNKCLGVEGKRLFKAREKSSKSVGFGLNVGVLQSRIATTNVRFEGFSTDGQIGYNLNVHLDYAMNERWLLRTGLSYMQKAGQGVRELVVSQFYDNEGEVLNLQYEITTSHIYIPVSLKYDVLTGETKAYVIGGLYYGSEVASAAFIESTAFENRNGSAFLVKDRDDAPFNSSRISPSELGWKLGAGVEYMLNERQSIYAEFQMTRGTNMAEESSNNQVNSQTIGLLVGATLF